MGRAYQTIAAMLGAFVALMPDPAAATPNERVPVHEQPDGTVVVGGKTYASYEAFIASPAFAEGGYRCATPAPRMSFAVPSDCSLSETVIADEYEPGVAWVIPVVFHLVEMADGTGHTPDSAVYTQIDILNEDFGALPGTPGAEGFDSRIRFVLAQQDPAGNPTSGINRYVDDDWYIDNDGSTDLKQTVGWDPSRYLNIYVTDAGGALGYATLPQQWSGETRDGVVLRAGAVGRDSPLELYNQGRTGTHEVGHYLGLFHTFDGGCGNASAPYTSGDLIADTVAEQTSHFECVEEPSLCGGGPAPIHNYMDYTNDTCMTHFSVEQINRMRCSVANYRSSLVIDQEAPMAAFSATAAPDGTVAFVDESTAANGKIESWSWDFGDGLTSTEQSPSHVYEASGTYVVALTVTDDFLGLSASTTREVDVTVNAAPDASFTYVPDYLHVSFTTTSTDDGAIVSHLWDFGDGTTSVEDSPGHDFPAAGSYDVSLTVTDDLGAETTIAATIMLEAPPDTGGCGCEVSARKKSSHTAGWILGLAVMAFAFVRRRAFNR